MTAIEDTFNERLEPVALISSRWPRDNVTALSANLKYLWRRVQPYRLFLSVAEWFNWYSVVRPYFWLVWPFDRIHHQPYSNVWLK